ncbi:hypothetical protein Btru_039002 [Bulinus truncatus]|nr:hypothetical protein Btru_039002 [Bulinus truncatus]
MTKGNSTSGNDLLSPTSKNVSDVIWLNATRRLLTNEAIKGRLTTTVTPKQGADIDEEAEGEPDMGRVMQTNFTGVNVTYKTEAETSSQSPLADDRDTKVLDIARILGLHKPKMKIAVFICGACHIGHGYV